MEWIPIKFSLTDISSEYNYTANIEGSALLSDDKCTFKVKLFNDPQKSSSLPPMEITVRFVAENTIPHWIDVRYQQSTKLSQEIGRAIEQTPAGKEYVSRCFLKTLD
jgi:hypothetical protein